MSMIGNDNICSLCQKLINDRNQMAEISTRLVRWANGLDLPRGKKSEFIKIMNDLGLLVSSGPTMIKKMCCKKNGNDKIFSEEFTGSLQTLLKKARQRTSEGKFAAMFLLSLWDGEKHQVNLEACLEADPDIFWTMIYVYTSLYEYRLQLSHYLSWNDIKPVAKIWKGIAL